ncbi:histone-lysine N-methyltransferase PRDM9-like [Takifugu flavidus]|uniref:histone-lysine N-methyltransferase PRDM9-like n=1 Tax=Takifugu flavidus TaxID=433684 RepID=UPI00254486DD|nr:histone-lysine N-methyltransferase PRDM9-like [Takifugu flavidus]
MCKEEDGEVLINQGNWNTERNSGLDPEDTKPQHMKEEHLRITAEEVVLKQETDASLFPPSSEVYREVQTLNPDKTTKQSATKLPLLNPVMSEPNSDPLLLLSTSCREDKVIGQRKTRRGGSRSTKQDKNITQPRQRAGKRHAKDVQKPSKLKRNCHSDRGEKSLKCDTCGKHFKFKSALHIHIRIHTGEKPYVCKTCGKSFTQQGHLSSHILIHTGEKPYVCLTCKKGFLRKKSLRDHMIIHTGLQPHVCVTCEKGFILKKDLTAHIRTHNAEKPHVCQTCGNAYTLKSTLRSQCESTSRNRLYKMGGVLHLSWELFNYSGLQKLSYLLNLSTTTNGNMLYWNFVLKTNTKLHTRKVKIIQSTNYISTFFCNHSCMSFGVCLYHV